MKKEVLVVSSFQAPKRAKKVGLYGKEERKAVLTGRDIKRNIEAKYEAGDRINNALTKLRKELLEMQEQDKGLYKQLTKLDENIRRLKNEVQVEQERKALFEEEFDSDSEAEEEVTSCNFSPKQTRKTPAVEVDFNHNMIIKLNTSRQSSPGSLSQDSGISADDTADMAISAKPIDLKSKQGGHCDANTVITSHGISNKFKTQIKSHRRSASEDGACTQLTQTVQLTTAQHPRSKSDDVTDNGNNIPSCIKKRKGSYPDLVKIHCPPNPSKLTVSGQSKSRDLSNISENDEQMPSNSRKSIIISPLRETKTESLGQNKEARQDPVNPRTGSFSRSQVGLNNQMRPTGSTGLRIPVERTQSYGPQPQAIPPCTFVRNPGKDLTLKRTNSLTQLNLTGAIFGGCAANKKTVIRQPALPRFGSMGRIVFQQNSLHSSKVTKEIYDDRRSSLRERSETTTYHQTNYCRMSSFSGGSMGRTSSIISLV